MVCVKSIKLLLDDSILQSGCVKVNGSGRYFTICLQPWKTGDISFVKYLKIATNPALTKEKIRVNI